MLPADCDWEKLKIASSLLSIFRCFSETWGPPYDPHSYASSWKSPDEAHFAAFQGMTSPITRGQLIADISNVLLVEDPGVRETEWQGILQAVHASAIDLPFSGKRNPTVINRRLAGYMPGQQQFDYPLHTLQVMSGPNAIVVAPGAQTGLFSTVGRLDPHTYRPNEFFANNWVYEGLVSYGPDGVIEPSLATAWTTTDLSNGDQRYTFTLRTGVTFHDGAVWDCSVARLNFDHVLAAPLTTGDWHGWYDLPQKVKNWACNDASTFVFETTGKYYPLLQELSYIRPLRMLSPTSFVGGAASDPLLQNTCHTGWDDGSGITGNGVTLRCAGITAPSGTGPWKYVDTVYESDGSTVSEVNFVAHSNHWRAAPHIDSVKVKVYATHNAVKAALLDGSLDVVVGSGVLTPADLNDMRLNNAATHGVYLGPVIINRMVIINGNKAPTNEINVRKTIIHGVNKAAIIDKELYGFAEPVDALFPKTAPYCNVDLTPRWDYDLQKAKLLNCPVPVAGADDSDNAVVWVVVAIVAAIGIGVAVATYFWGKKSGEQAAHLLHDIASEPEERNPNGLKAGV